MPNDSNSFTKKHVQYLTSPDYDRHMQIQPFRIDPEWPLNKVIEKCRMHLHGEHQDSYQSIPELMQQIEELLHFLREEYEAQASEEHHHPSLYLVGQAIKVPLYVDLIREISASYKVSSRRYLLGYLCDHCDPEFLVEEKHIHSTEPLDPATQKKYTDGLIQIAKKVAKGRKEKCGGETTRLLRALLKQDPQIDREKILHAGFALGMNTQQLTDFSARVLGDEILPLTTPDGLVYRFCLDTGKSYSEANLLLDKSWKKLSENQDRPLSERKTDNAYTYKIAVDYERLINENQNEEEFLSFLHDSLPSPKVGSRSTLALYRILALYYTGLTSGKLPFPDSSQNLQFTLRRFLTLLAPVGPGENQQVPILPAHDAPYDYRMISQIVYQQYLAYMMRGWDADSCVSIRDAMIGYEDEKSWCYLQHHVTAKGPSLMKVSFGNRIYSNLLGDYRSIGEKLPRDQQRIMKEDLLILLYKIIRFLQEDYEPAAQSAELAEVFWYIGERYLSELTYGLPNGAVFYVPHQLEYSLLLSIAANVDLDEMEAELYYSMEARKTLNTRKAYLDERNWVLDEMEFELADSNLVLNYSQQQIDAINVLAERVRQNLDKAKELEQVQIIRTIKENAMSEIKQTVSAHRIDQIVEEAKAAMAYLHSQDHPDRGHLFTDKLKNLRKKFAAKYDADLSGLEPLIEALDGYFRDKTYVCSAYFDDQGVWGSLPADQNRMDSSQCIFFWGDAMPDILKEAVPVDETHICKELRETAKKHVKEAELHCDHSLDHREKTEHDAAIQLWFMVLCRQLQCRHPELDMKFSVYAGENRKIKLSDSKNIKKAPKKEVRSAVKQIQQATPELQKAEKPKTRKSKTK